MPRPRVWGAGGGRARGPWWGAGEEEWKEVVIEGEDEAEKVGGGLVGLAGGGPVYRRVLWDRTAGTA